jgi:hypothetical protein
MLNVTNMWNDQFKTSQQLWIDMKQIYVCKNLYIEQDFNKGQLYQIMLICPSLVYVEFVYYLFDKMSMIFVISTMLTLKIMWTNFWVTRTFSLDLKMVNLKQDATNMEDIIKQIMAKTI